jgi:tRNA(Met) cytidine acetyltransferase
LRGEREETLERARAIVGDVFALWPDDDVRAALGRAFDAVILSLHDGVVADDLGAAAGLVRGGGLLVVCAPHAMPPHPGLVVHPYGVDDVGDRFWHRVLARLDAVADRGYVAWTPPASSRVHGTDEQRVVVARLVERLRSATPTRTAVLADRGRGKSSALGLALREVVAAGRRVVVTAPREDAAVEVFHHAGDDVAFVDPAALAGDAHVDVDVIVVDEAAQLPVPLLRALVARHPRAHFAFATTTHGYEGTGRGFVVRFLEALDDVETLRLTVPIRWDEGDPVEQAVNDALLLNVDVDDDVPVPAQLPAPRVLDRARLAGHERLLRSLFGLLVHAHYRTTPGDLQRLLDAPNLAVHAVVDGDRVLGATLVAREGALPAELSASLSRGRGRIRGHALADTLVTHAARPDAGVLRMFRSVRIAVHPAVRRRRLARALVAHVHATYAADLFGTVFGATPEVLRFRRGTGYVVVRVGATRGARSGEPSVVMLHGVTLRGHALVRELRQDLARDLALQLRLLGADGAPVDDELARALGEGLPDPVPLDDDAVCARVQRYLDGPQPFEAAAWALTRFVERANLGVLDGNERALVRGRVLQARSWDVVAQAAGYATTAAAMRALRPAVARLWAARPATPATAR